MVEAISEERVSERIVEQIVFEASVLVPPTKEEIADSIRQPSPQEHIQERVVAQLLDVVVPPTKEEVADAVQQLSQIMSKNGSRSRMCTSLCLQPRRNSRKLCGSHRKNAFKNVVWILRCLPPRRNSRKLCGSHKMCEEIDIFMPLMQMEIAKALQP